jgi:hypothetical protein
MTDDITPEAIAALLERLGYGTLDPVDGSPLEDGVFAHVSVEDVVLAMHGLKVLTAAEARIADYEARLASVMPVDFKDWHDNSKAEWPSLTASLIANFRDQLQKKTETQLADQHDEYEGYMAILKAERGEVLALRKRVAELERAGKVLRDDMLERAQFRMDTIHGEQYRIVNAGNSAWVNFCAALKGKTFAQP